MEADEAVREAATRETCEEGGVVGQLGPKLGCWTLMRRTRQTQCMWLLFVHTEHSADCALWAERKQRLRGWYSFDDARALFNDIDVQLRRPELVEMLEAARIAVGQLGGVHPMDLRPFAEDGFKAAECDGSDEDACSKRLPVGFGMLPG